VDVYLVGHYYDLPDGRVLPVRLVHYGHDRYRKLTELRQQLIDRRQDLGLTWHVIQTICVDMTAAVEEQMAVQE